MKPNKYDTYKRIIKVIESCTTKEHLKTTFNLYNNFRIMFNDSYLSSLLLYDISRKHDKLWPRYGNE